MSNYDKYPSNIPAHRIGSDGRIISQAQLDAGKAEARLAARSAQILADRNAENAKPESLKRVEFHKRQIAECRANGDREGVEMWKDKLEESQAVLDAERAVVEKAALFAASEHNQKILAYADRLETVGASLYPDSPNEVAKMIAIARDCTGWPTPLAQYQAVTEIADRLDAAALEKARTQASDKGHAALKAEVDHAESEVLVAEIELARQQRTVANE